MIFKNVKYLITTHKLSEMPQDNISEIVIVGKSNVGKSTFINSLTNNKNLAKTSSIPGKTRAISLYNVNDNFRLVDIPGYGYSKVSKDQKIIFGKMIDEYFEQRKNISKSILLLDIRRKLSSDDMEMINYFVYNNISFLIIGTKLDKVNQSEKLKFKNELKEVLGITPILYSSISKKGLNEINELFLEYIK